MNGMFVGRPSPRAGRRARRGAGGDGVGPGDELRSARRHRWAPASTSRGDNTYPFDLMKITCDAPGGGRATRYATNIAEVGLGGEVARRIGGTARPGRTCRRLPGVLARLRPFQAAAGRVDVDTKIVGGTRVQRHRGQRAVHVGRDAYVAAVVPGRRRAGRPGVHGPALGRLYACSPGSTATATTSRTRTSRRLRAKIRIAVDAARPLPVVADGAVLGITPATFQVVPQQTPAEAMTGPSEPRPTRLRRATAETERQGFEALVVAPVPGPRVPHGLRTRCRFERPTLLVLRPRRDPVMLVPELERPLAQAIARWAARSS